MLSCMRRLLMILCTPAFWTVWSKSFSLMAIISSVLQGWNLAIWYDLIQVRHCQWWSAIHSFLWWDYQQHRLRHWNWLALVKSQPRWLECKFSPLLSDQAYTDCCAKMDFVHIAFQSYIYTSCAVLGEHLFAFFCFFFLHPLWAWFNQPCLLLLTGSKHLAHDIWDGLKHRERSSFGGG